MTYVSFLRAVNVGGTGLVKMADLKKAFVASGCRNVRTFIASGNVLFDAPDLDAVRPRVQKQVARLLNAEPVIVFRTMRELEAVVNAAPFGELVDDPAVKLYVMFMAGKPVRRRAFPFSLPKEGLESIGALKGDVFIVSRQKPNGWYGFPANWIEKELGVQATARSWSTVTRIVALARGSLIPRPPLAAVRAAGGPSRAGRAGSRSRAS
jgi:uncharacterized protein (DUF1697 family)